MSTPPSELIPQTRSRTRYQLSASRVLVENPPPDLSGGEVAKRPRQAKYSRGTRNSCSRNSDGVRHPAREVSVRHLSAGGFRRPVGLLRFFSQSVCVWGGGGGAV